MKKHMPKNLKGQHYQHPADRRAIKVVKSLFVVNVPIGKLLEWIAVPIEEGNLIGNSMEADAKKYPKVNRVMKKVSNRLSMKPVKVYVIQEPTFNAFAFGTRNKQYIYVTSGLLDALKEKELEFVVGHEMGHIQNDHVLYHTVGQILTEQLIRRMPPGMKEIGRTSLLLLFAWERRAEFTADRSGLIASEDFDASWRGLVKLMSGKKDIPSSWTAKDILKQKESLSLFRRVSVLYEGHPFGIDRIHELERYAKSKDYNVIIGGKDLTDFRATPEASMSPEKLQKRMKRLTDDRKVSITYLGEDVVKLDRKDRRFLNRIRHLSSVKYLKKMQRDLVASQKKLRMVEDEVYKKYSFMETIRKSEEIDKKEEPLREKIRKLKEDIEKSYTSIGEEVYSMFMNSRRKLPKYLDYDFNDVIRFDDKIERVREEIEFLKILKQGNKHK